MENCPFKDIVIGCVGSLSQKLDETRELKHPKSVTKINAASKKRKIKLTVEQGMLVHEKCRRRYINTDRDKNCIIVKTEIGSTPIVSLRSKASNGFEYKTHCIFCEIIAVDENGKKLTDVHQV